MALAETAVITAQEISDNPVWQRLVCLGIKRNIRVFACDFRGTPLERRIRGYCSNEIGFWFILVDVNLSEEEKQATLAHELGHYYTRRRKLSYTLNSPREIIAKNEEEADRFARRLLWWVNRNSA